ncbi:MULTISPECIES: serine hydrolase domain-containing protein [unclassified Sphingomonas]|uniref:serine hydrolase domain-containing protein n=1 Tax=unclassified Sphingomonas TaxID=196159 RepID=UPI000833A0F8|nr:MULTISPECIES: serine hydrolase [unclassified Sphingomonas]
MRLHVALVACALSVASVAQAQTVSPACAAAAAYSDAHRGRAVLILKDGRPLCEAYAVGTTAADAHPLYSGTKSFAGAMAVLAVQDGLLDLDEPVSATLSEWRDGTDRQEITIRQLLSLSSGIESVVGRPPDYAQAVELRPVAAPGTRFAYGPAPFQIFGEVMRRKLTARGMRADPADWLIQRLLNPAGIRVGQWRRTPDGNPLLPQGMALTAQDWARFGEWVRRDGVIDGKASLAPQRLAAFHQPSSAFSGYGLTWWLPAKLQALAPDRMPRAVGRLDFAAAGALPDDLLMAAGAGDQRLYVSKRLGITIVRLAQLSLADASAARAEGEGWSDGAFLRLALQTVQPATE